MELLTLLDLYGSLGFKVFLTGSNILKSKSAIESLLNTVVNYQSSNIISTHNDCLIFCVSKHTKNTHLLLKLQENQETIGTVCITIIKTQTEKIHQIPTQKWLEIIITRQLSEEFWFILQHWFFLYFILNKAGHVAQIFHL